MRVVILLAGLGRRMRGEYADTHKALIPLFGKPILFYLLKNMRKADADIDALIPVLGYKSEDILECINTYKGVLKVYPVYNRNYSDTNNLVSLLCAEDEIKGEEFILCNGDMIFNYRILDKIIKDEGSRIAVDSFHKKEIIDSPRVKVDEKILDLSRNIKLEDSDGYAVGIYKFGHDLINVFFERAHRFARENKNYGFHDPLKELFSDYDIYPTYTDELLWMDVDEESDVKVAENCMGRMIDDYR